MNGQSFILCFADYHPLVAGDCTTTTISTSTAAFSAADISLDRFVKQHLAAATMADREEPSNAPYMGNDSGHSHAGQSPYDPPDSAGSQRSQGAHDYGPYPRGYQQSLGPVYQPKIEPPSYERGYDA